MDATRYKFCNASLMRNISQLIHKEPIYNRDFQSLLFPVSRPNSFPNVGCPLLSRHFSHCMAPTRSPGLPTSSRSSPLHSPFTTTVFFLFCQSPNNCPQTFDLNMLCANVGVPHCRAPRRSPGHPESSRFPQQGQVNHPKSLERRTCLHANCDRCWGLFLLTHFFPVTENFTIIGSEENTLQL